MAEHTITIDDETLRRLRNWTKEGETLNETIKRWMPRFKPKPLPPAERELDLSDMHEAAQSLSPEAVDAIEQSYRERHLQVDPNWTDDGES